MSDPVADYIKGGSGDWLNVKNCNIGSIVTIQKVWIDDSFDDDDGKPRKDLCVGGIFETTGEECQVRLSKTNARRIADALGGTSQEWIGNQIKCVLFMDYPGVNARGIIWDGIKPEPQKKLKK